MKHKIEDLPEKITIVLNILAGTFFSQFKSKDTIMSYEAHRTLQNPSDRKLIDEAVQKMKNSNDLKKEEKLTLSNNRQVTLSID